MAERVVDLLEVVEVDQHAPSRRCRPPARRCAAPAPAARAAALRFGRPVSASCSDWCSSAIAWRAPRWTATSGSAQRSGEQQRELGGQHRQRREPERHARRAGDEGQVLVEVGAHREPLGERDDDRHEQRVDDEERQRGGHDAGQVARRERRAGGVRHVGQRPQDDPRGAEGQAVLRGVEPDAHGALARVHVRGDGGQHERRGRGRGPGGEQQRERERRRDGEVALGAAAEHADRDELADEREEHEHGHGRREAVDQAVVVGDREGRGQHRAGEADAGDVEPEGAGKQGGHGGGRAQRHGRARGRWGPAGAARRGSGRGGHHFLISIHGVRTALIARPTT